MVADFRAAFPDLTMKIDDLIAEGDEVALRWSLRGTHRGDLMGIPATVRAISVTGSEIWRIVDGRVVEGWASYDTLGMMQQLGIIPIARQAEG